MSSYVENSLIKDEEIIYTAHLSLVPIIIWSLITLPFAGLGILIFILGYITYLTTELAFTNKRIIFKEGLIRRTSIELNINKVESIQVDQGILGRILNYGSLRFAGAGNPQAPIPRISAPMAFRRAFMEFQDKTQAA